MGNSNEKLRPSTHEPFNTMEDRLKIESNFIDYHTAANYHLTEEVPPYPSPDSTVQFIGAQISVWKPVLKDVSSGNTPPLITPQNCIRLQNKDCFYTPEPIYYSSYFRTMGALGKAALFPEMVTQAEDYLIQAGVSPDRICIKTTAEQAETFRSNSNRLIDTEPSGFYFWRYGDPMLSGKGVTLAIRNELSGEPNDIGNVILIYYKNEPLVTEWGFGIETLLAAKYSVDHPIYFADLPTTLQAEITPTKYKYLDALMTAAQIIALGVRGGERGAPALLNEYLLGSAYLAQENNKDIRAIEKDARTLANHIQLPLPATEYFQDRLQFYTGRINFMRSKLQSHQKPESFEKLLRLLGISSELANILIRQESIQDE